MPGDHSSPLDVVERSFQLLASGPDPLALHGGKAGLSEGRLPARAIPLDELRAMLLHPSTSFATRDAVVGVLVRRAQRQGPPWQVGLAGVLMPGLRAMAGRAARDYPGDTADVDAEILAGLFEALDAFDPERGQVAARLLWAAFRRASGLRSRELAESTRRAATATSHPPLRPWGHPDLVLARAVSEGVVSAEEAEVISATRIGGVLLPDMADALGVRPDTLRHRRRRAELRLVRWLHRTG